MSYFEKATATLLTGVVMAFAVGSADAADMLRRVPAATPLSQAEIAYVQPSRAHDWTGFYGGGFVEYGFGKDRVGIAPPIDVGTVDVNGFGGGITAGYNYQNGNFVVGLEADLALSGMHDRITSAVFFGSVADVKYDWYATLRPRVGYAVDNFLFYATAGLAAGGIDYTVAATTPAVGFNDKATRFGLAAGAGVEYAFSKQISLKAEYLYTNLATHTYAFSPGFSTKAIGVANHVRVGLNYHF